MQIYCGTDIIEIKRIRDSIERLGNIFLNKIYTKKEIEYCESKGKMKYQHYAARFATKEAVFKAISKNLKDKYEVSWTDGEITNDENGRPIFKFINGVKGIDQIDISISHCNEYAVANAIVIFK